MRILAANMAHEHGSDLSPKEQIDILVDKISIALVDLDAEIDMHVSVIRDGAILNLDFTSDTDDDFILNELKRHATQSEWVFGPGLTEDNDNSQTIGTFLMNVNISSVTPNWVFFHTQAPSQEPRMTGWNMGSADA